MFKNNLKITILTFLISVFTFLPLFKVEAAREDFLTEQEILWLENRNNTIVVYPEKDFPPYSYYGGTNTQLGLSIDYLEIVAEKIGAKIEYLPAKSLFQVLEDMKTGKGDVLPSVVKSEEKQDFLYFTDYYTDIGSVIVVRKDSKLKGDITLNDLAGQKVAITNGRAVRTFVAKNYPRVIIEPTTDDEIALQQVVLGEVDAAVLDIASLSFYLSKQVLSSVNIVGNAGFSYKLSFGVKKENQILQSILDKGLLQISKNEREILNDKWIVVPEEVENNFWTVIKNTLNNDVFQYTFFLLVIFAMFFFFRSKKTYKRLFQHKAKVQNIKEEMEKLEEMNSMLSEELEQVREDEEELKEKLKSLDK
jgi:ABC-type amino acid transport substrate-binding protein